MDEYRITTTIFAALRKFRVTIYIVFVAVGGNRLDFLGLLCLLCVTLNNFRIHNVGRRLIRYAQILVNEISRGKNLAL